MVALAILAERESLGKGVQAQTPSGVATDLSPDVVQLISETARSIYDLERLEDTDRMARLAGDSTSAAMAVGAHIARDGENHAFFALPWSPFTLTLSLFAAAATSAALSRLAVATGIGSEVLPFAAPDALTGLTRAAGNAYGVLDETDRLSADGFGTVSHVVEDILSGAGWIEDFEETDAHRLSAKLIPAFMAGYEGQPCHTHERGRSCQMLLAAANMAGRYASGGTAIIPLINRTPVPPAGKWLN